MAVRYHANLPSSHQHFQVTAIALRTVALTTQFVSIDRLESWNWYMQQLVYLWAVIETFCFFCDWIAVTASASQQTEDRAFCPVVQLFWLRAPHCTDYHVTSLLFLRVTCPCSLRTYATLKFIRSSLSSFLDVALLWCRMNSFHVWDFYGGVAVHWFVVRRRASGICKPSTVVVVVAEYL